MKRPTYADLTQSEREAHRMGREDARSGKAFDSPYFLGALAEQAYEKAYRKEARRRLPVAGDCLK